MSSGALNQNTEALVPSDSVRLIFPEKEELKMLGAQIDADIYWKFKTAAATRKENMKEALEHAALLYIDAEQANKESDS